MILGCNTIFGRAGKPRLEGSLPGAEPSSHSTGLQEQNHSCFWLCPVRLGIATPWTVAYQASLSMGFPRQEYWCGLPWPSPRDLFNPGVEPTSLLSFALRARLFTTSATCNQTPETLPQKGQMPSHLCMPQEATPLSNGKTQT